LVDNKINRVSAAIATKQLDAIIAPKLAQAGSIAIRLGCGRGPPDKPQVAAPKYGVARRQFLARG
jgi:hypothetical protein